MFARYKKSMLRITGLLRNLQTSLDDVSQLLALQRNVAQHIVRAERRTVLTRVKRRELQRQLKAGRLPKPESNRLRSRIAAVEDQISMYQQLVFIWRCFGDGIAFSYLDKFALKHAFFNTHDLERKQRPGALSGKEGLRNEWKVVNALCSRSLPAMLSDITNIIRHGDVCLLGGPDPFPIEVKSSRNRNARVDRQVEHLKALHAFYDNDTADDFRGLPGRVSRQEFKTPEVTYIDELNKCIEASKTTGYARVSPEKGLNYMCFRGENAVEQIEEEAARECVVVFLNQRKISGEWPPYYPFTLSIRDPEALFDFIDGNYSLLVSVHVPTLIDQFERLGITAKFLEDDDYVIQLDRPGAVVGRDLVSKLSQQLFGRIFFELQSLSWFARVQSEGFDQIERDGLPFAVTTTLPFPDGPRNEDLQPSGDVPKEWHGSRRQVRRSRLTKKLG